MSDKELRVNHLQNQIWAMLDGLVDDIVRIADGMSPSSRDEALTQKVMLAVGGLLIQRRAEAKSLES